MYISTPPTNDLFMFLSISTLAKSPIKTLIGHVPSIRSKERREVEEDSPWCWVQINTGRQTDMRDIKNDLYYSHGCLAHLARKAAEI